MTERSLTVQPIGFIHSPLKDKLLIPRQPGLAPSVHCELRLAPEYGVEAAWRGIEEFSHLWLHWYSHATAARGWKPTVRPPRLGGNRRRGVFATRSTHRPNPFGLSVVRLLEIKRIRSELSLILSGADLLHGTPVIDVKPYLPYVDRLAEATASFAADEPTLFNVVFAASVENRLEQLEEGALLRQQIAELLAQAPRPAYQATSDAARRYTARYAEFEVSWCIEGDRVIVQELAPARD